jgi:glycosyltransferase involved in cell wall biosynthesis
MRIAAISNSRIPSVTANSIQAMKVCDALAQNGHDVRLIVPVEGRPASWTDLARHYGIRNPFELRRLPSVRFLRRLDFVWYAHAAAKSFRAELTYTWLPQTAAFEAWLGKPVVLEMHADAAGLLGAWWLRRYCAGSGKRRLLVTTHGLRTALERSTGMEFEDELVRLEPNGVDLARYVNLPWPEEARAQLQLHPGLTAGFTGHFYAGRGIELLFELARALPSLNFLWVGGTPEAVREWRGKLEAAGLENVTLTGFVENSRLSLYQAAADILLMPYGSAIASSSGQDIAEVINPMKMFEYMAAGRAIITADLPAIREVLDESMAVFCPPGDLASWKTAIMQLTAEAGRRVALAENARRRVENYTWTARARRGIAGFE